MVQDARTPEGVGPEGERRKTAILREGPARQEVLSALQEEQGRASDEIGKAVASGTLLEGFAGTGAAVLAILALLGTTPLKLTAIGVIVLGGALLLSAGGFATIAGTLRHGLPWARTFAGGAGLEAIAGAAVVAGGILVLVGVSPTTFLPVAILVLGACFIMASGGLRFLTATPGLAGPSAREVDAGESIVEILVGLAGVALGVLGVAGMNFLLLCEVAVLTLGAGLLAKCMAYSARTAGRIAGA
jgi:hypothetical protein